LKIPRKIRAKKVIAGMDFEVWRHRCPQGGPKGYPRHLPGLNFISEGTKMEIRMEVRII